jgi:hypothetical protein
VSKNDACGASKRDLGGIEELAWLAAEELNQ